MQKTDVSTILKYAYEHVISNFDGSLASYIPELANIDPDLFAISYVDVHGNQISIGDCESLFTGKFIFRCCDANWSALCHWRLGRNQS